MSPSRVSRSVRLLIVAVMGSALLVGANSANADPSELAPKHVLKNVAGASADNNGNAYGNGNGDAHGNGNANNKPPPPSTNNGISYHGGPVMTQPAYAYVIWYGSWSSTTTPSLVTGFLGAFGGSSYYNINTTYYNGSGTKVPNNVTLGATTTDSYSHGTALSDAGVQAVVSSAITSGRLPSDPNGVYFVLTSGDVSETSGFLSQYCGWHTHGSINGTDIKYSFVGDASASLSSCAAQTASSPNNNPAGDAMLSVIAHELEESTSDPDLNAWYDTRGYENADKCAWTFGTTYKAPNGSTANMSLGGRNYLIQRNWANASGGYCTLSYP